jgi:hypothetical protein
MKTNEEILKDLDESFQWAKEQNAPCSEIPYNKNTFILCLNAARKIMDQHRIHPKNWTEHDLIGVASCINYEVFENKTKKYDPSVGLIVETLGDQLDRIYGK